MASARTNPPIIRKIIGLAKPIAAFVKLSIPNRGSKNMGSRKIKTYNEISLENLSSIGLQLGLALERSKLALKLKKG